MLYALLRALAGVALRWYYRDIDVDGLERVPPRGPVLLAVNHPNALVDALVVGWVVGRRVRLTAKATLFANPVLAWFLRRVGVVPLVRARDLRAGGRAPASPERNRAAFRELHGVLRRGGAVLIFPEGISHDAPSLAPLRTGAARIALQARTDAGVAGLVVVPMGLIFERKEAPRSRVLARVGEPIDVDDWAARHAAPSALPDESPNEPPNEPTPAAVQGLTVEIEARLRAVTLNYATADDAARAAALASLFAALVSEPLPVAAGGPPLRATVEIARRVERARAVLAAAPPGAAMRARADALRARLIAFERQLASHRVALEDVDISLATAAGARFLLREGGTIALAGPVAVWGAANHWLPFHAARAIALRSVESLADPAMRTIVAGAGLVLACYAAQGALVAWAAGPLAAALYLASLPVAADVNFHLRARLRRAWRRARAYLLFRRQPRLHERLRAELAWLREEALALDEELRTT